MLLLFITKLPAQANVFKHVAKSLAMSALKQQNTMAC